MIRSAVLLALTAAVAALPAAAQETPASARAKLDGEFAVTDTNKDGFLSSAELEARMSRMKAGGKPIPAVNAKRLAALFVARADADKDGKVSEAESQAVMRRAFARFDRNKDGKVDRSEMAAAQAAGQATPGAAAKKPR